MSLESDLEDATRRLEEATELLDGGPIDFAHGTVKGLGAIVDATASCADHPFELVKGLWELLSD